MAFASDAVGRIGAAQGDALIDGDIMADLGGTLDFESVAGPGARFVARFPAREIA